MAKGKTSAVLAHPATPEDKNPPEHLWWSEVYQKSFLTKDYGKKFRYYDTSNPFKFLFFHWVVKWTNYCSSNFLLPVSIHPLLVADQILRWQPVFSKHVSDGLHRLETFERAKTDPSVRKRRPYKSILVRAMFATLWKRMLLVFTGIVLINVICSCVPILVKKLLEFLNDDTSLLKIFFVLGLIILLQITDGLVSDNIDFYTTRMVCMIYYLFMVTLFQHGLAFRRKFYNNVDGSNTLNVCNGVLHSCSPDSKCSKNPLYCLARRHQNTDITPNMFTFLFTDAYYVSFFVETLKNILAFVASFVSGVLVIAHLIKLNIWVFYSVAILFVFAMFVFEGINALLYFLMLYVRDYRAAKSTEILSSLPLVSKMKVDDVAMKIITRVRNNELVLYFVRILLSFINSSFITVGLNVGFYIILNYFMKSVEEAEVVTDIETAAVVATFYSFLRVFLSLFNVPQSLKFMTNSIISFCRLEKYIKTCSPNFYVTDNMFTGKTQMSLNVDEVTKEVPKDTVVLFKDASFTWVNNREDVLNRNYRLYLKDVNFHLKRGEVAVVAGSQGSGKSNLVKAVLGEMTLVGGSMAVAPLHTDMPIFYASQDIWLQQGTVRSNITFGYKYVEELYKAVLRAAELEFDISTWEDGDSRFLAENGHTLSGGQRVRVEMARAIYAYLVFNKVNAEYNDNKCSFLMCLDAPFNGLDPFVSKTIFKNLFDVDSGLLVKGDLSVLVTATKTALDKFLTLTDTSRFPVMPVYTLKDQTLSYHTTFADMVSKKAASQPKPVAQTNGPYYMNFFTTKLVGLCRSDTQSRTGRRAVIVAKYQHGFNSYIKNKASPVRFNPYAVYFTPATSTIFMAVLLTLALSVMDDVKMVIVGKLTDYIGAKIQDYNDGKFVDLSEIKALSREKMRIETIIVSVIITFALLAALFFSLTALIASRKIHEYCLRSVFEYSSFEVPIKRQMKELITFIFSHIIMIDEDVCPFFSLALTFFIFVMINMGTMFYLIPLAMPFVFVALLFFVSFTLIRFFRAVDKVEVGYLEAYSNVSAELEVSMNSSPVHRSFKKERDFMKNMVEHTDYFIRCKFLIFSMEKLSSVVFNWAFSLSTFAFLFVLVVVDRFTNYKFSVGNFGMALSFSMRIVKTFTLVLFFARFVVTSMCSVRRFQCFIPLGQKVKFGKYINTHEEDLVVNNSSQDRPNLTKLKASLVKRRKKEFKQDNRKFYMFRRLTFSPRFNFYDVTKYVTPDHSGVELKDVTVYTSLEKREESAILKGVTVSAFRSDVIGIIGRTGAGKTTLLSVLDNTMRSRTGQVLLDGTDLNDIPRPVLRQVIGVLPQLPFVFKSWTVRRFLDPRKLFTDEEINDALEKCGLLEFVSTLPGGKKLDSVIIQEDLVRYMPKGNVTNLEVESLKEYYEECNMLLSSNQLRTLSLARMVLYRNFFRVVLVDEPPTENIDSENAKPVVAEKELGVPIYELLKKYFQHCTTFVTAHDSNALRACNSVWVLHHGTFRGKLGLNEVLKDNSISNIIQRFV